MITRVTLILIVAFAATGCHHEVVRCADFRPIAASVPRTDAVTLRIDYGGAVAMLDALERDSLSDAAVDSLLGIHGFVMTMDNVTRYVPRLGRTDFRKAIREFVRTRRDSRDYGPFGLRDTWAAREQVRALIATIRQNESAVLERTLVELAPYKPATGPLQLSVYLVAGGVSDGFVPDNSDAPAFYANLTRANGDCEAVLWNIAHEAYHVMQKAALRRVPGLAAVADSVENLPGHERLMATVLMEGAANLAADPTRYAGNGPEIARWRKRYQRDAEPARIRENFALFDTLFQQIGRGQITWTALYDRGFANDAPFYGVGRAMAQAIERYCGVACIGRLFERRPIEFFRDYIQLYRAHPEIAGRFDAVTERLLVADR